MERPSGIEILARSIEDTKDQLRQTREAYITHMMETGEGLPSNKIRQRNLEEQLHETQYLLSVQLRKSKQIRSGPSPADPFTYAQPFCDFLTNNPTVFHAVSGIARTMHAAGYTKLSERAPWRDIKAGGKYYVVRNSSCLIAFSIGKSYKPGNGIAMIAGHVDALTAKLKPISNVDNKAGYTQLGVAPYAGGLNSTWWDRDLAVAGRVMVRDSDGKITEKLVDLKQPIARVPTLAPHFGAVAQGKNGNPVRLEYVLMTLQDHSTKKRRWCRSSGSRAHLRHCGKVMEVQLV